MQKNNSFNEIVDQVISHGVNRGLLHLFSENERISSNVILLNGNSLVNFGSCSYLGLEQDVRLKNGAHSAIDRYGTQFSSSRAYLSLGLYKELEQSFEDIFNAHCLVTPTTTLGHLANLPVLVENRDAVIIDQQVHSSVQTAVSLLKVAGINTEILRHNRMDLLEERVDVLRNKYKKIWYLADGIYSMYGDSCPVEELHELMNKYESFHCYIDDAHGMSIYGKRGRGYVLNVREMHPKMVIATSLAKAFATGGAVMIYPNKEMARKVRTCGGPLITSGPLQPANLGAAIACAAIHLTPEIEILQNQLRDKIKYTAELLEEFGLPVVSERKASIFFVGVSLPKLGYNIINRLMNKGHYVNLGVFPAVSMKNTGIRFTITRLHSEEQIYEMVKTLANEFPQAVAEEGMKVSEIYKAFKMPFTENFFMSARSDLMPKEFPLKVHHYKSIEDIEVSEWDKIFENNGSFDWNGMQILEKVFSGNDTPENNWLFDYIIIKDESGKIVVATFITTALWKDDMFSPAIVSSAVEKIRADQAYYLTNLVTATGSLLTEGEHVFIDRSSAGWNKALLLLVGKLHELQEVYKANAVIIRDFQTEDKELSAFFIDNDFVRIQMPDSNIIDEISFKTVESFYQSLSNRSRQHFREDVKKHLDKFEVEVVSQPSPEDLDQWYQLYLNVKSRSLELNTFLLPKSLFSQLGKNQNWEAIVLKLKPEYDRSGSLAVCVIWCYKTASAYIPMIIGVDYSFNSTYKIYRQALFQIVMRAATLNKQKIYLGFAAVVEKKKLGAKQIHTYAFIQYKDGYNMEVLAALSPN